MKNLFCLIFIGLITIGCSKKSEKPYSKNTYTKTVVQSESCIPYFDFDEVEYYHTNISREKIDSLADKKNKSENDSLFIEVMIRHYPKGQKDSLSIGNLENLGYIKKIIPDSEFEKINQLFCERKHEFPAWSACAYYNKDILIFKKNNQNVGIAKMCFGCELSQIFGSKRSTLEFGQSGDFEKLNQLLSKYRKK